MAVVSLRWLKRRGAHSEAQPSADASRALRDAGMSLHEAIALTGEVDQLVKSLDDEYHANHFVERMNMHRRRGTA